MRFIRLVRFRWLVLLGRLVLLLALLLLSLLKLFLLLTVFLLKLLQLLLLSLFKLLLAVVGFLVGPGIGVSLIQLLTFANLLLLDFLALLVLFGAQILNLLLVLLFELRVGVVIGAVRIAWPRKRRTVVVGLGIARVWRCVPRPIARIHLAIRIGLLVRIAGLVGLTRRIFPHCRVRRP